MLRLGVQSDLDPEVAEALLRYFARRDDSACNRDKATWSPLFYFAIRESLDSGSSAASA